MSADAGVRRFCIDIDNVIAATDVVMRQVIRDHTGGRVSLAYDDVVSFHYHECCDAGGNAITPAEWSLIHEAFSEPRYLWRIEPVVGAVEGLRRLADHGVIHIVTSRRPRARRVTVEWLEAHGVPPHQLHFVSAGEKHAALRPFSSAVEDDYDQAVSFAQHGTVPAFLLRHPWNRARPAVAGVVWVDGWGDLTDRMLLGDV